MFALPLRPLPEIHLDAAGPAPLPLLAARDAARGRLPGDVARQDFLAAMDGDGCALRTQQT